MIISNMKIKYIYILFQISIFNYSYTLAQQNTEKVVASKTVEDAHYDFLKELHSEESKKSGKILNFGVSIYSCKDTEKIINNHR